MDVTSKLVDLHSTEHGDIDATSTNHTKGLVTTECRGALDESDSLLAGVDEVRVCNYVNKCLVYISACVFIPSSPGLGYRPIPRMPFSDSRTISVPSGRKAGAARGMPMPRLTYMPSLSSWAARLIMRSRFWEASVEPAILC